MSAPSGGNAQSGFAYAPNFLSGFQVAWSSNTTLTVSNGNGIDSTNVANIDNSTVSTTINCANNGLNGLDTGSLSASTTYYVHAIGNSLDFTQKGFVVSKSATSPTLPLGFDCFRWVDYQITDSSSHLLLNRNFGSGNIRNKIFDAGISVLSAGTAVTLTAISLAAVCPEGLVNPNFLVDLDVSFTPNTAGDRVSFATYGSTSTTLPSLSGSVSAVSTKAVVPNILTALNGVIPEILYINSAASGSTTVSINRVEFNL